ncbi:MCE family protein [Mycobacterium sp. pUA109]|uniref:MCE family protein n=1 Tax=Mycobacterium sp. pUA109 TaxID=3238982 RepID=UPI00351B9A52
MTGFRTRRRRGPWLGLTLFLVVTTALTWLVYGTLRRDVKGPTVPYAAVFTDVFGLRDGDDVRIAGVRVGRVQRIELDGTLARVSFVVAGDQRLPADTVASVTYQNIVGQRYLALAAGHSGRSGPLAAGSVIPVEHTEPSFDIGALLNGYEPLFAVLDPDQVNNLTAAVIGSLQGDTASLTTLVTQTSTLTKTFTGRDNALDSVIASLDQVVGALAEQNDDFADTIAQTRRVVSAFDGRRPALVSSAGKMTKVLRRLAEIAADVDPPVREMLAREPGYTRRMLDTEPQAAYTGRNTPLLLKGLARIFGDGAYMNVYGCDANIYGFFPGLNDIVPIIVDAATPGGKATHTPRCRNTADG